MVVKHCSYLFDELILWVIMVILGLILILRCKILTSKIYIKYNTFSLSLSVVQILVIKL